MSKIEDIRDNFSSRLDEVKSTHQNLLAQELGELQEALSQSASSFPKGGARWVENLTKNRSQVPPPLPRVQALVNMTNIDPLKALDDTFFNIFDLSRFYPRDQLAYRTVFCESLEEFFTPFLSDMNYSALTRQNELHRLVSEAEGMARERSGIFGVNFPGQGCYLNGWLFATLAGISPREVIADQKVFAEVLCTAAHEKLGHGFLSTYSTLGEIETELGLSLIQIASQFGTSFADDASIQLRYQQNNLLFTISQIVEEGWATWIENFFKREILSSDAFFHRSLRGLLDAMDRLPETVQNAEQVEKATYQALRVIFDEGQRSGQDLLQAVSYLDLVGEELDDFFSTVFHQPLRYVLGQLIYERCAENLGEKLMPFVALLAANVTFDPAKISLTDLSSLLLHDARLNPDARLVAISRIKLDHRGDLKEFVQRVNSELSFSIPQEMRKS